jgi:FtsH-binding integral membrane protein
VNQNYQSGQDAIQAGGMEASSRAAFIVRTYSHLLGAISAFTLLEIFFFASGIAETIARSLLSVNWLYVLGGFIIVSWFASRVAHKAIGLVAQYLALGVYIVAEAVIFVPLLSIANYYAPGAISSAATVTLLGFGGLTVIAFWTRKNFSFLGGLLRWALVVALVAIVGSLIFGFRLGTWFSVGMVGVAGVAILHDTSKIIHDFPEDRHVGATLELFASVALMLWYVLRLFSSSEQD